MNILLRWVVNALAIMAAAYILPGVYVGGFWVALVVALILGLVNVFLRPLLILLTLPITIVTLGLFIFVINAVLVLLVSRIVSGFFVAGFWPALLFSLLLAVINAFFGTLEEKTIGA